MMRWLLPAAFGLLWALAIVAWGIALCLVAWAVIQGESPWYWLGVPMIVLGALVGLLLYVLRDGNRP